MVENDLKAQVDNMIRIGIALSSELDIDELLEMIVDESRRFTRADGGTLYILSDDKKSLRGKIVQNDTLGTRIGGTSQVEIDEQVFAPIPLAVDGQINHGNVSAFVANTGRSVNIEDVFETEEFDFAGPRLFYEKVGFRTKSMLVVPLRNHEDDTIGVLMLLNAQDTEHSDVIPFSKEHEALITALASQAAVGITNAQLIQDLQNLFDAFIQTIGSAIDEKSSYTGGHIRRVADLTMMISDEINLANEGLWGRLHFNEDELNELRISAWLHDVGKITTPEYVVDKATKLETIYDRIATYKEKAEALKSKIKKAMFYPVAVVVVAFIVTTILLIFVVPQFEEIFSSFGAELPAFTQFVLAISRFVQDYGVFIAIGIGIGGYLFARAYKKSQKLRDNIDRNILKTPVVGEILKKASIARFTRTLATTFAAGVPLIGALESAAGASGNAVYRDAILYMRKEVAGGMPMHVAMRATQVFPDMVTQMIAIGEESGAVDEMLSKIATIYEAEVDDMVDGLTSLLEPMIMAVLGVVIGGLIVAMYLPIFQMGNVV